MNTDSTATSTVVYVIVVVVAVLVASVLAPVVWGAMQSSGDDDDRSSVSVVTLRGGTSPANVASVAEDLREARGNESTEAVVLRIDSTGGAVTSSEELYLAVNRTAAEMPVVAYVEGYAASGGYFGILPADAIYVKPSSVVGSVGVVASVPEVAEQNNDVAEMNIRSGPDKQVQTVDELRNTVESLKNSFVGSVMEHRGDALDVGEEQVSRAGVYYGTQATENGFADGIGSLESAVAHAANASGGIDGDDYDVHYKEPVAATGGIVLADEDVADRDGNVVYVESQRDGETEFVQPVEYYAVWGIPADATADGTQEVTRNESD